MRNGNAGFYKLREAPYRRLPDGAGNHAVAGNRTVAGNHPGA